MEKVKRVRVRFAPSPTGSLHIGGLRTAFYNYLFAKHHKGDFLLRIEDTDQNRKVAGAVEQLLRTMKLFNIEPDEGPVLQEDGSVEEFGSFGPYRQSARLSLYQKVVDRLLREGSVYRCFCTSERLETLRAIQVKKNMPTKYDGLCRKLTEAEQKKKIEAGELFVIRLKMPQTGTAVLEDLVRGKVEFSYPLIDDQVLLKSDGYPTYHLANVVDDHEMQITHVIRGEEWLPSVPKHLFLYEALGWEPPQMAHLPMLLDENRAKLSKRKGSVSAESYIEKGYLPDALLNFILLLGWNPKTEQEIFSREEMISLFSLEQVNAAGAAVNEKKLLWINREYLQHMPAKEIDAYLTEQDILTAAQQAKALESESWLAFLDLVKMRVDTLADFQDAVMYYFEDPQVSNELLTKKAKNEDPKKILKSYTDFIHQIDTWTEADIRAQTENWLEKQGISRGNLLWPVRVALTGREFSPGAYELLGIFSKETVLRRLNEAAR